MVTDKKQHSSACRAEQARTVTEQLKAAPEEHFKTGYFTTSPLKSSDRLDLDSIQQGEFAV